MSHVPSLKIEDKRAIITGGAMGIGWAISQLLAHAGAKVLLVDLNQEKLDDAKRQLVSQGYEAETYAGDITKTETIEGMLKAAV